MRLTNALKIIFLVGIIMEVLALSYYAGYERGKRASSSLNLSQFQSQTTSPTSSTPNSPATSSPVPTTTSEIDTSDWKTYRNEEYGISFDYPISWGKYYKYAKGNTEEFEKTRGITYFFKNNSNIKISLESENFKQTDNELYSYLLDGLPISLKEEIVDIDDCNKNREEPLLCKKCDLNVNGNVILEDRIFCIAGPTGGDVNCGYYRFLFFNTKDEEFPVFVLSMHLGILKYNDDIYKKCNYELYQDLNLTKECFRREYKPYFDRHKKELNEFSQVISTLRLNKKDLQSERTPECMLEAESNCKCSYD